MTVEDFFRLVPQVVGGKRWWSTPWRGERAIRVTDPVRDRCDCPLSALHAQLCQDPAHAGFGVKSYYQAADCLQLSRQDALDIVMAADGASGMSRIQQRYRRRLLRRLRPERRP